jgi:lycopene beta-cyclase
MRKSQYDIIMAGGGAASRILLYFLQQQKGFENMNILILEAANKIAEKTWCFWTRDEHPFEHLIAKTWQQLEFRSSGRVIQESIDPYRYCCIKGVDFDHYFNDSFFPAFSNISILNQTILSVEKNETGWSVHTRDEVFTCNRLVQNAALQVNPSNMLQHFHGWFVEYDKDVFEEDRALLMDFTMQDNGQFCFFYVLPFSSRKALVECTYYSAEPFDLSVYRKQIEHYLLHNYGAGFQVLQQEQGAIPLQLMRNDFQENPSFIPIGSSAGMIKPSTGYAFERMVEDSKLLAASILHEQPVRRKRHNRFRFYDGLLLSIIREEPEYAATIFQRLFQKSSMKSILTFLDENSSLADEVKLFSGLPWWPFLKRIKFLT